MILYLMWNMKYRILFEVQKGRCKVVKNSTEDSPAGEPPEVNSVGKFNFSLEGERVSLVPRHRQCRQRRQMRLSCVYHKCVRALTCYARCDWCTGYDSCAERFCLQSDIREMSVWAYPDVIIWGRSTRVLYPNIHV